MSLTRRSFTTTAAATTAFAIVPRHVLGGPGYVAPSDKVTIASIGMGRQGMAVTMDLRLDESSGSAPSVKVLMLLDRQADVHLARRSAADGWIVKPFTPLALKKAVQAVLSGQTEEEPAPVAG